MDCDFDARFHLQYLAALRYFLQHQLLLGWNASSNDRLIMGAELEGNTWVLDGETETAINAAELAVHVD